MAGTIMGYTICFASAEGVRQITMANKDEGAIERLITTRFGELKILSRAALDAAALELLGLKPGASME